MYAHIYDIMIVWYAEIH